MSASDLVQRQQAFAEAQARLVLEAVKRGYKVTLGHAYRCEDCGIGRARSLHKLRLAIDINLWKDGQYLTRSEDYHEMGVWWESIGGSWGGRYNDGNHFSFAWGGRR